MTLEDMYKITTLKDYFKKIKTQNNISDVEKSEQKETKIEKNKEEKGEPLVIFRNPLINANSHQFGNYRSDSMLLDDCEMETNYLKGAQLNNTQNRIILREINDSPYTLLKENYSKIKSKKDEEKEKNKN